MCVQMRSDGLALAINETKRAREVTVLKVRNFFFPFANLGTCDRNFLFGEVA